MSITINVELRSVTTNTSRKTFSSRASDELKSISERKLCYKIIILERNNIPRRVWGWRGDGGGSWYELAALFSCCVGGLWVSEWIDMSFPWSTESPTLPPHFVSFHSLQCQLPRRLGPSLLGALFGREANGVGALFFQNTASHWEESVLQLEALFSIQTKPYPVSIITPWTLGCFGASLTGPGS